MDNRYLLIHKNRTFCTSITKLMIGNYFQTPTPCSESKFSQAMKPLLASSLNSEYALASVIAWKAEILFITSLGDISVTKLNTLWIIKIH